MSDLAIDCLLATVGLLPKEVTPAHKAAAAGLPDIFRERALAWWERDRKKFDDVEVKAAEKLFDKIAVPPSQLEVKAWLDASGADDDVELDLKLALTQARQLLVARWAPLRVILASFAGPRPQKMAIDDAAEVGSLWAILNDRTRILDELDMGSLSPSQAEVYRDAYPALYEHLRMSLHEGAVKQTAKDPEWMPDEAQTVVLGMLTGRAEGPLNYDAAPAAQESPTKPPKDLGAGSAATQADVSAKPTAAKAAKK